MASPSLPHVLRTAAAASLLSRSAAAARAQLQPWQLRQQRRQYQSQAPPVRSRYGRVSEGRARQATAFDVDLKMDEVKEALNRCGTVQKAWGWALANIWGVPDYPSIPSPAASSLERFEQLQAQQREPRYGVMTPYYAPAVHSLFLHFRDSLRSPHAALMVIDAMSAHSSESLVLGSTAALYSDVVKLHWSLRRDLDGVRDVVRMAKRVGILSTTPAASGDSDAGGMPPYTRGARSHRFAPPSSRSFTGAPAAEDAGLRAQIELAVDEARREALSGVTRAPSADRVAPDGMGLEDVDDEEYLGGDARSLNRRDRRARGTTTLTWAQNQQLVTAQEIEAMLSADASLATAAAQ